ncbi:uncharacterized protein LOC126878741 [Diabrotica virgifera virgifera]|nr:uncharacterized protein LOC126878741 [Diabrotica virgifera virgifera]
MAKMSKILVLFDKGQGLQYKGKSLEDIDIDPTKDLVEACDNSDDDSLSEPPNDRPDNYVSEDSEALDRDNSDNETTTKRKQCKEKDCNSSGIIKKKAKNNRVRWTEEQKKLVKSYFKGHIKKRISPKKEECQTLIDEQPILLKNLDWVKVKTFVYNNYRK